MVSLFTIVGCSIEIGGLIVSKCFYRFHFIAIDSKSTSSKNINKWAQTCRCKVIQRCPEQQSPRGSSNYSFLPVFWRLAANSHNNLDSSGLYYTNNDTLYISTAVFNQKKPPPQFTHRPTSYTFTCAESMQGEEEEALSHHHPHVISRASTFVPSFPDGTKASQPGSWSLFLRPKIPQRSL